jgi:hypothetical protein
MDRKLLFTARRLLRRADSDCQRLGTREGPRHCVCARLVRLLGERRNQAKTTNWIRGQGVRIIETLIRLLFLAESIGHRSSSSDQ